MATYLSSSSDIVVGDWDGIYFYKSMQFNERYDSYKPNAKVQALAVSPNGKELAITGYGWTLIERFDLQSGKPLTNPLGHQHEVEHIAIGKSRDVLSTGDDNFAILWNMETAQPEFQLKQKHLLTVAINHDNSRLALCGLSGVSVYSITGKKLWEQDKGCQLVRFLSDGSLLAADSALYKYFDTETGKHIKTATAPNSIVSLGLFDTGRLVLWKDFTISIVDVNNGKTIEVGESDASHPPAFSPDKRLGIAHKNSGGLLLFNADSGNLLWQREHMNFSAYEFSPDGRFLALGDKNITILTVLGQPILYLKAHEDTIRSLKFTKDGKRLISASGDSTILAWNMEKLLNKKW